MTRIIDLMHYNKKSAPIFEGAAVLDTHRLGSCAGLVADLHGLLYADSPAHFWRIFRHGIHLLSKTRSEHANRRTPASGHYNTFPPPLWKT